MLRHNTLCRKIEYLIINNFILFMDKVYVLTLTAVSNGATLINKLEVYKDKDEAKNHLMLK